MGAVQTRRDVGNYPFFLSGDRKGVKGGVIAQDAGRTTVLEQYTVLGQDKSTLKYNPLDEVDPAATPGSMLCGAAGAVEVFQAVADGSFGVTVDGELLAITGLDFTDIEAPTATGANLTTGAFGSDLDAMQAIVDGSFQIVVDGNAYDITGLDFSDIEAPGDTAATLVCGANGGNLAAWQAVTAGNVGSFNIVVNGTAYAATGLDFAGIDDLSEIVEILNGAFASPDFTFSYDQATDTFTITSNKFGEQSTIGYLTAGGAGTDISGAAYLNGLTGTGVLTQGIGGDGFGTTICDVINVMVAGAFRVEWDALNTTHVFFSPRRGAMSTIGYLTAGSAGTDISGAAYLNGLTGTGVLVQGTGDSGEDTSISDIINDAALGRFRVEFDGAAFRFLSPTTGAGSAITVLTAGGAGTDISGAAYLNGLTGTGVATAATGLEGANIPAGIYIGEDITAADIVAGDVIGRMILTGGNSSVAVDDVVYEGGLDKDSIVVPLSKTIEDVLADRGIFLQATIAIDGYENV